MPVENGPVSDPRSEPTGNRAACDGATFEEYQNLMTLLNHRIQRSRDPRTFPNPGIRILSIFLTAALVSATSAGVAGADAVTSAVKITAEATGRPLREVLQKLSGQTGKPGFQLLAEREIGEQRVSFRFESLPLDRVLDSLARLLSHSAARPDGYQWRRREDPRGTTGNGAAPHPVTLILRRSAASRAAEQRELELPQTRTLQILTELRKVARTAPEKRTLPKTGLRLTWLAERWSVHLRALASLSDRQFADLCEFKPVTLDPIVLQDSKAASENNPDPMVAGSVSRLSMRLRRWDRPGEISDRGGLFCLEIDPSAGITHPGWDVYSEGVPSDFDSIPDVPVDLKPWVERPNVTREMRGDVGFLLQGVANAAKLTFFQEHFYQPVFTGGLARPLPPADLSGSSRKVVRNICQMFNYRMVNDGETYYFWPYAWALARGADIPEPELSNWRQLLARQGEFSIEDRIRMAMRYSHPQLSKTMRVAIRQAGRWDIRTTLALRVVGLTPGWARRAMERSQPIPLNALEGGELGSALRSWLEPPGTRTLPLLGTGQLTLVSLPPGSANAEPHLAVWMDGAVRWSTRLSLRIGGATTADFPVAGPDIDP